MASGIYQIENQINRKCYVGSAINVQRRWQAHLSALRRGQHGNRHLQRAFDRYGESAFEFSILEHVEDSVQLISREQRYLDILSPEYNIAPTAGSSLGIRHTLQSRQNMSLARIGKPHPHRGWHFSEDTKRKLSEALTGEGNPNYGKPLSDQHRRKISEAQKAHWSKLHAEQNHHTGDFQDAGHELVAEGAAHERDV